MSMTKLMNQPVFHKLARIFVYTKVKTFHTKNPLTGNKFQILMFAKPQIYFWISLKQILSPLFVLIKNAQHNLE